MSVVDNEIKGRLVLITGASSGIGAACAKDLAKFGCDLALTYSANKAGIEATVEQLNASKGKDGVPENIKITIHQVDLGDEKQAAALVPEVQKDHGRSPDIVISNAGYGKRISDPSDIPLSEFDHTMNVNLRSSFIIVQATLAHMKEQKWGRIIFVSSIASLGAGINGCHYAASKGATTSMMKNMASRLAPWNISVNDVSPAMIGETGLIPSSASVPGVVETIPLGRLGLPYEVANAVTMFARTGYITGQSLVLAGGLR